MPAEVTSARRGADAMLGGGVASVTGGGGNMVECVARCQGGSPSCPSTALSRVPPNRSGPTGILRHPQLRAAGQGLSAP